MLPSKYKFSGHQTFVFRFGWLEKGVQAVAECATVFSEEDALVRLGVGKNMVASIRHWCQVTQLVEPDPAIKKNTGRYLRPTEIAKRLLLNGGWDPYLEDDASLWLIHWLLVTHPSIGTAWNLLFSRFNHAGFTRQEITTYIKAFAEKESLKVSHSVVTRDVDCLIRTYVASAGGKKEVDGEETFGCPLSQLNLVQPSPCGEIYRFSIGPKPSLPAAIFAFALGEYFDRARPGRNTMSIHECLYGAGSPGQVFKLDENSLMDYVEDLEEMRRGDIALDETAGLRQIYRREPFDPLEVLGHYYQRGSRQ